MFTSNNQVITYTTHKHVELPANLHNKKQINRLRKMAELERQATRKAARQAKYATC